MTVIITDAWASASAETDAAEARFVLALIRRHILPPSAFEELAVRLAHSGRSAEWRRAATDELDFMTWEDERRAIWLARFPPRVPDAARCEAVTAQLRYDMAPESFAALLALDFDREE